MKVVKREESSCVFDPVQFLLSSNAQFQRGRFTHSNGSYDRLQDGKSDYLPSHLEKDSSQRMR